MSQYFDYEPRLGVLYARTFAMMDNIPEEQRLFYYDKDDDCTNFISQCIWASYGGWIPGFTQDIIRRNAARIRGDVRQVKGAWYGSKNNIGSNIWCRVEQLYRFVVNKSKPLGPVANKLAEGSFEEVDPAILQVGDIIQMIVRPYKPNEFGHSVYVTQTGGSWDSTLICCHTDNRLDVSMDDFTRYPDIYTRARVLRFSGGKFAD